MKGEKEVTVNDLYVQNRQLIYNGLDSGQEMDFTELREKSKHRR